MLSKNRTKFLKSLQNKKVRDSLSLFVIEGEKNVIELIENKLDIIDSIYVTEQFDEGILKSAEINYEQVSSKELEQISGLKTPNKALAVCKKWDDEIRDFSFVLALDSLQDPGNFGTLIRLADWYGVDAIICSNDTVEKYNPKVIQASMGSVFRTKVFYLDLEKYLRDTKLPIYGALLNGENVYSKSLKAEGILILGNEGNGISNQIEKLVQHCLTIPKHGKTESLNVATAGAILLSEFFRSGLK